MDYLFFQYKGTCQDEAVFDKQIFKIQNVCKKPCNNRDNRKPCICSCVKKPHYKTPYRHSFWQQQGQNLQLLLQYDFFIIINRIECIAIYRISLNRGNVSNVSGKLFSHTIPPTPHMTPHSPTRLHYFYLSI